MCGRRSAVSRYFSGLAVSKREELHPLSLAFIHVFPIYVVIHVEVLVVQRWQEYTHTTPEMKWKNRVIEITSHLRHSVITKTKQNKQKNPSPIASDEHISNQDLNSKEGWSEPTSGYSDIISCYALLSYLPEPSYSVHRHSNPSRGEKHLCTICLCFCSTCIDWSEERAYGYRRYIERLAVFRAVLWSPIITSFDSLLYLSLGDLCMVLHPRMNY